MLFLFYVEILLLEVKLYDHLLPLPYKEIFLPVQLSFEFDI